MRIDKTNQRRRDEQKDRRDDESLSARIDKTNKMINETKRRIDEIVKSLSARIDENRK